MKNFKEIADKCLNGELSGTFIKKAGGSLKSKYLHKCTTLSGIVKYPYYFKYGCLKQSYSETGKQCILEEADIVDFIPDTDMKENELTIEIPDNKVVDWDESKKQNKIVLKDKQLTYKDISKCLFFNKSCYTTGVIGNIVPVYIQQNFEDPNKATTKHQLECILAKNQLANVATFLNDGWKPTIGDSYITLEYFYKSKDVLPVPNVWYGESSYEQIIFHSEEDALKAIDILGEETIKLALEPLGI